MSEEQAIQEQRLQINGRAHTINGDPDRSLLGVLRDEIGLTGAKYGCGEAQCGACVVLLDGAPIPACITPVGSVEGGAILTIEGLANERLASERGAREGLEHSEQLHPVQEAFLEADAFQCGYCTPGMILAVVGLLAQKPDPSEPEIIQALQKHVCRCGTYRRIMMAIGIAARNMQREGQ